MLSSLIRSTLVAATLLGSLGAAAAAPREAAGATLIDYRGERHHGRDRWEHRGPAMATAGNTAARVTAVAGIAVRATAAAARRALR